MNTQQTNMQEKQVNVVETVNSLLLAVEKTNRSGAFSMEESAKLYAVMIILKKFFQSLVDSQDKKTETVNQEGVVESVNSLFVALEKGNRSGAFSMEESAKLYTDMIILKKFFENLTKSQDKKLETVSEDEVLEM